MLISATLSHCLRAMLAINNLRHADISIAPRHARQGLPTRSTPTSIKQLSYRAESSTTVLASRLGIRRHLGVPGKLLGSVHWSAATLKLARPFRNAQSSSKIRRKAESPLQFAMGCTGWGKRCVIREYKSFKCSNLCQSTEKCRTCEHINHLGNEESIIMG